MTIAESSRSMEELFDLFCTANSFSSILQHFNQLCAVTVRASTAKHPWNVYRELRASLKSYWKAAALFEKLDKRVQCAEYMQQTACNGVNVIVVGCGPCGLRCAIELALLGARVVILEKRDKFSRNNVLHLWPYLIDDLRALGAKTFFGKFCAGSIDHISIRTLQCILLKAALLFGVQIFPGVTYHGLVEPTSVSVGTPTRIFLDPEDPRDTKSIHATRQRFRNGESTEKRSAENTPIGNQNGRVVHSGSVPVGWRVHVEPEVKVLQNYETDVLIGADGKRSCLEFPCKELRCRLAIAITANFINYHTTAEAEVEEISGVSSIFNQQFFASLASATGIDLENIVYYKDETHYFVMTAKKHSLLNKGVLKQDRDDSQSLLSVENIDKEALQKYARETANYVTNGRLPRLDFATNARGEPDVDAFDFTRIFAAEYSCQMIEKNQYLLMQCLVGDGLFEPFWPTGSGCALGFLSALDAAWAVSRLASGHNPLQVLAHRESVYQRLSQTTAQNMPSNFSEYTLDPRTRYTRCNVNLFGTHQVRHLYHTDRNKVSRSRSVRNFGQDSDLCKHVENRLKEQLTYYSTLISRDSKTMDVPSPPEPLGLLRWCQSRLSFYETHGLVTSLTDLNCSSWDSGVRLLCLIHLYRPELVPELEQFFNGKMCDPQDVFRSKNSHLVDMPPKPALIRACGVLMEHFDVEFISTDKDSIGTGYPRSNSDWLSYLNQVYHVLHPLKIIRPPPPSASVNGIDGKLNVHRNHSPNRLSFITANGHLSPPPLRSRLSRSDMNVNRSPHKSYGVVREDPNWTVEKGLLPKRRAELIAGFISDNVARLFKPTKGSSHCYLCSKRLYPFERQEAFGHHFHRHCFRCSTCGTQLQPDRATHLRADSPSARDLFYCVAHSPLLATTGAWLSTRRRADSTGVSLVDRLRAGEFPFAKPQGYSVTGSAETAIAGTSDKFVGLSNLVGNTTSKVNMPQPTPVNKSSLLAGLSDEDNVLTAVDVRQLVRNFRANQFSSSSSPSPVRKSAARRKVESVVGPSGDSSPRIPIRLSIRDDDAPGPECYLAGHLGLPEVERRANWELNTIPMLPGTSIPDLLEHMRSSESDEEFMISNVGTEQWITPIRHPPKSDRRKRLQVDNPPLRCLAGGGSCNNLRQPFDPSSVSDPTTVVNKVYSPLTLLPPCSSNPVQSKHLEAKQRFCLEPPKPLTIDPKLFIGAKNLERVLNSVIPDCSETVTPIDDMCTVCCLPLITLVSVPLLPQLTVTQVWDLTDTAPTYPTETYTPRLSVTSIHDPEMQRSRSELVPTGTEDVSESSGFVSNIEPDLPVALTPFSPLDDFRDIDSTSTVTERSSTEPTPEREEEIGNRSTVARRPVQPIQPHGELYAVHPASNLPTVKNNTQSSKSSTSNSKNSSDTSSLDLDSIVSIRPKCTDENDADPAMSAPCPSGALDKGHSQTECRAVATDISSTHPADGHKPPRMKTSKRGQIKRRTRTLDLKPQVKSLLFQSMSPQPDLVSREHPDIDSQVKPPHTLIESAANEEMLRTAQSATSCSPVLHRSVSEPLLLWGYPCGLSTTF
ncbi:LIM domain protein [Opisthorchis viverrini]|uniref:LIM domain protein n=1 Tax=Opisthorchis viverrini TaxID=6198 RepID=A0A1S8WJ91_OPIVI|nr:LIM domain protein [Opisthorchis viverrini]